MTVAGRGPILWLASYPGSGNTWVRVLLANLLLDGNQPVDINRLPFEHAGRRSLFDAYADVESSDLTPAEVEDLRPAVYEAMAAGRRVPLFVKIHDAWSLTPSGEPLISSLATRGAVYVVRNPLDVAVSYAHHRGAGVDDTIRVMGDPGHALSDPAGGISIQLTQRLGTWSGHVRSWLDAPGLPVHVVRYEDLKRSPLETLGGIAAFSGVPWTPETLERAVRFSAFGELRRQEKAAGFSERSRRAPRFFRRGEAGAWREELTAEQVGRVVREHGRVMRRLGYLGKRGDGGTRM